jgi:hypothetical protein
MGLVADRVVDDRVRLALASPAISASEVMGGPGRGEGSERPGGGVLRRLAPFDLNDEAGCEKRSPERAPPPPTQQSTHKARSLSNLDLDVHRWASNPIDSYLKRVGTGRHIDEQRLPLGEGAGWAAIDPDLVPP